MENGAIGENGAIPPGLAEAAAAIVGLEPGAVPASGHLEEGLGDVIHHDVLDERRKLLGEYLIERGLVSKEVVKAALREQKVTGDPVGIILVRNGFLSHTELVNAILEVSPDRIVTENASRSPVPVEILTENSIMIAAETRDEVLAATLRDERTVMAILEIYYPGKRIKFVPFSTEPFEEFIARIDQTQVKEQDEDNLITDVPAEEVLDKLVFRALGAATSDIHVLPRGKSYTVLFRRDGVRQFAHEGTMDEFNTVVAQVKDRARMDLAERRLPQDGSFQVEYNRKLVDIRVATLPAVDGEIIVMRLLDPDRVQPSLTSLGITRVDHWRRSFTQQSGLCLICGPTGSGKTTTLNASIREMDRFGKAIYSIEDPVEYRISYTGQVSANHAVHLDFARAVRAFMRADPDVIILGEVRDPETARNAVKAADTGHLVLATLHTGSIHGSLTRLRDLEVPSHELKYLLRGVMVQTLVRVLCKGCQGAGCRACLSSGYAGRTLVTECVQFRDAADVERAIAGECWWPSMVEDAVGKAREGVTDFRELRRVFGSAIDQFLVEGEG